MLRWLLEELKTERAFVFWKAINDVLRKLKIRPKNKVTVRRAVPLPVLSVFFLYWGCGPSNPVWWIIIIIIVMTKP